jgi:hypothetical protein
MYHLSREKKVDSKRPSSSISLLEPSSTITKKPIRASKKAARIIGRDREEDKDKDSNIIEGREVKKPMEG